MKYNSIGEQLIAKAQELDPNYKPDKFNDMSEALDVILNNAGSEGGDIWLDITPYLNEDMTAISQEGYDLVWNAFYIDSENPVNKYIGILFPDVNKAIFSGFVMHGDIFKIKFSVSGDTDDEGKVQYDIFISSDKSISISTSAANGIWYKLDSLSFLNNVTQTQYDEIKTLATNGQLAGITDNNLYCPLYLIIGGAMGFQIPWTENGYISNNFFTIKEDLSVSLTDITPLVCPKTNPTSQVIPSINTANEQQNLTIGDGLIIENGVLKSTGGSGGGTTLYKHELMVKDNNHDNDKVYLTIIKNVATPITKFAYSQLIANMVGCYGYKENKEYPFMSVIGIVSSGTTVPTDVHTYIVLMEPASSTVGQAMVLADTAVTDTVTEL